MSRKDAHAFAASLAATLMVSIVVFQAGDGTFGAVPADEIDGDEVQWSLRSTRGHKAHGFSRGPGEAQGARSGPFAVARPADCMIVLSRIVGTRPEWPCPDGPVEAANEPGLQGEAWSACDPKAAFQVTDGCPNTEAGTPTSAEAVSQR